MYNLCNLSSKQKKYILNFGVLTIVYSKSRGLLLCDPK